MKRFLFLALLAGCGSSREPLPTTGSQPDPRIRCRILYVLENGGVFRYDELATAMEQRNRCEVRTERDDTFTRYSFTLHAEGADHLWTSL